MLHIVFLAHPAFLGHQSMPRFARMLADGMRARGHAVTVLAPTARVSRLPAPRFLKKWLQYADQYLLFPSTIRRHLKRCPPHTLFVFTDQALGPWVPLVADRPHVIHCHDFLAQRAAQGEIAENPVGWPGRQYQRYIRQGYAQGKHFIAVSEKTRHDLLRFLPAAPRSAATVYNGLNQQFVPTAPAAARQLLKQQTGLDFAAGYVLHVGGNQWYKNRPGVVEIYDAWRRSSQHALPLLLVGEPPTPALRQLQQQSAHPNDLHFLTHTTDQVVRAAYAGASVLLFPSLAEGFGWPIAEAMASGCLVVTTNEAPMTEVAGGAGFLIPPRPAPPRKALTWAKEAARVLDEIFALSPAKQQAAVDAGISNAKRFDSEIALDKLEAIYLNITQTYSQSTNAIQPS